MHIPTILLLGTLLTANAVAVCPEDPPIPPFDAGYEVERNGKVIGAAQVSLTYLEDGTIRYATVTEGTKGMARLLGVDVEETSNAKWTDCHYQGLDFAYSQKVAFRKERWNFAYDWPESTARGTYKKDPWELTIESGYADSLLVNLRLMTDVKLTEQDSFKYSVIRKGRLREYEYRIVSDASVDVPMGRYDTVHVERVRDKDHRSTDVWLDRSQFALPIMIRHVEDDDIMIMRLVSLQSGTVPPAAEAIAENNGESLDPASPPNTDETSDAAVDDDS